MKSLALLLLASSAAHAAVDITRQDLSVDLVASDTALEVTASLTLAVDAPAPRVDLLAPTLNVLSATIDGVPVTAAVTRYLLRLTPPAPLSPGAHTVELKLSGVPPCLSQGRRVCQRTQAFSFLPQFGPEVRWYLLSYAGGDLFTGKVTVRAPEAHQVAVVQGQSGARVANGDGSASWSFDYPVPTEMLGFVAGQFTTVDSSDGFVRGLNRSAATAEVMRRFVDDTARYYPIFTGLYGPLPLQRFNVTFVPPDFIHGAMGLFGLVFANEVLANPGVSYIVPHFAHEVAHSWWGNLAQPDNGFLSEAMAEYSLWRANGVLQGERAAASGRRMNAIWYLYGRGNLGDAAILDSGIGGSPVYVHVTYHKGSVVVRTLEEAVGTEALTRGLRNAVQNNPTLTTDAWLAAIQAETSVDLKPWRAAWLESAGFPVLRVASAVTGGDVKLRLSMAGNFPLQAPLRFAFSDGTVVKRSVRLGPGATDFAETFSSAPVSIEVDPEWTAVREVVPEVRGDVTLDGVVDGADLLAVAAAIGGAVPPARRMDGRYDPLFDVDRDLSVGASDMVVVIRAANP